MTSRAVNPNRQKPSFIGRPVLTAAFDKVTGKIVGFDVSLGAPTHSAFEALASRLQQPLGIVEIDSTRMDIMVVEYSDVEA
jgi:hypothetical protein